MAEQQAAPVVDLEFGKKCAQTGTSLKKVKRYYRNGKYFQNKAAFKAFEDSLKEEKAGAEGTEGAAQG
jgi:hypothetical protein